MTTASHALHSAPRPGVAPDGAVPDIAGAVEGAIAIAGGKDHMTFHFGYGEIPVTGRIAPDGQGYRLDIQAPVGIVPYSMENREARMLLRAAIDHIKRANRGGVGIDPHHEICVQGERHLAPPLTAVSILSGLVALMVEVRPLFEMVAEHLPDLRTALPAARV